MVIIDTHLVQHLIATQFPAWAGLAIRPVEHQGWDNRTFRLGHDMVVRLPSAARYAEQVEKEQRWLPHLASRLPVPVPLPIAMGTPSDSFPWPWSVCRWIEGKALTVEQVGDTAALAKALADFLVSLHAIDASGGPLAGPHNFFRGGSLRIYDLQTRAAIKRLEEPGAAKLATTAWEEAIASEWTRPPLWVHGDFTARNLLVDGGRLSGVIDFGCLAVGDPACDLAIAWTLMEARDRRLFSEQLALDAATWARARGWALWKALILATGAAEGHPDDVNDAPRVLTEVLRE